jgi:biopolymer transport protein ExbD
MRWNRRQDGAEGHHDVNMTPLIDVSLVLVVILLLATPLAFESSFAVRETGAAARRADDDSEVARIELEIVSDATVRVNRETVPVAALESAMRRLLDGGPTRDVTVDCADAVSHGTFVAVLDAAKAGGAGNIAVMGR